MPCSDCTPIKNFDIEKIADSGQCFRIKKIGADTWRAITGRNYVEITKCHCGNHKFSCTEDEFNRTWKKYFSLDEDNYYTEFYERGLTDPDEYIREAVKFSSGMRILKQDPFETLISFIISQRNRIPKITAAVEEMCCLIGDTVTDKNTGKAFKTFPVASELSNASDALIDSLRVGYRDEYIKAAAKFCYEHSIKSVNSYDRAKALYGVGPKVANCYCLYGLHQLDRFPIDVWIQRILDKHFNGSTAFLERYKGFEGILQQCMFYYERNKV